MIIPFFFLPGQRMMLTSTLALLGLSLGLVANAFPTQQRENGKNWVVIVAGSNGWYNYRHQADACHAYQIVHRNGIPDEQIVVMMYDDLATNEQNPTPGVVINRPNGTDVYKGVPKDYTGDAVTADNFLAVLKGDSASAKGGSGKVLKSGPNDHVFVYFTDHGAPGLLAFPNDDVTMDFQLETYLGDWYSVNWMEDSDVEDLSKETLIKQFKIVRSHTNTSHVMQFGNKTLAHMKVMAFQGNAKPAPPMTLQPIAAPDLTPSPDVPLAILKRKLMRTNDISATKKYFSQITSHLKVRELLGETMRRVVETVTGEEIMTQRVLSAKLDLTQHQCYQAAVNNYKMRCFNWHITEYEYALRHLYALVNLCEGGYPTDSILMAMEKVCHFN
uniref:Legumain n=1 Tax=Salmo trutta TaxID=8032 RepID=A0A673ZZC9_SALTR